jgi:UDPglucose--hexose-1-phosphate uridylyltransferase
MMNGHSHRRYNPLRDEWVLVSPQRNERPWQGQVDVASCEATAPYDPGCYLCPGNARAHGVRNPAYTSTFAFDNDYPALWPRSASFPDHGSRSASPQLAACKEALLVEGAERGICRVLCFSPRHDLTLARMDVAAIRAIVDAWVSECTAVAQHPWVKYVLVFENRGEMMGASNPHPHCQIWATEHIPNEPARERHSFESYHAAHGGCLLCDYTAREIELHERVVCRNESFLAVVPFWAAWPFETLVISRRHTGSLDALDTGERDALADIFKRLTSNYDNLFDAPFPYSMGFHQAPVNSGPSDGWHLHAHFYPPLLRSATIRKFMVGFELLGSPQRDLTPEQAAARLQECAR